MKRALLGILLLITILADAKNGKLYNNIRIHNNTESVAVTFAQKALQQDFQRRFGTTESQRTTIDIILNIDKDQ